MARKPMTTKDKIREWISDNLRYMLLGLAILLIVGLITLLVHLLSTKTGTGTEDSKNQPAAVTSSVSASQEAESESEEEPIAAESVSAVSASSAESTETEAKSEEENVEEFAENNKMDVTTLCTSYYEALGKKDITTLKTLVDSLSDEEAAVIQADTEVSEFRDISVYTMEGLTEGTYIAFARYTCMYNGIVTGLPSLSEIYVYTTADGTLKVMENPESDAAILQAMTDAQSDPAVVELIDQVTTNYEIALESDPALESLVSKQS